jgi:hypothetical protein
MENYNETVDNETAEENIFPDEYQLQYLKRPYDDISISDNETASNSTGTSSKKQRSWVWAHFTYDDAKKKPLCNYCKVYVSASKGSTSGMANHLKNKHPTKTPENNQLTLHETVQNIANTVSFFKFLL